MRSRILWIVFLAVGLLLVIQLIRPRMQNPPVESALDLTAVLPVTPEIAGIFERSCNDCHSNRTVWPAYSRVAPASWLVASDVKRGRRAMNFSVWGSYAPEQSQKLISGICKEVTEGEMPGLPYKLMHPVAKLSAADVQSVCRWTQSAAPATATNAEEE
jgi:hypothetical protein